MPSRPDPAPMCAARLRQAGLRVTEPRLAVYGLLREIGGHRSADEIVSRLTARGLQISRMSVYNVVAALTTAGLVMCADTGPGRAVYEATDDWHHHFVCRDCGAVFDVPCSRGKTPCLSPPRNFSGTVDEAQVIFRGRCAECAQDPS